MKKSKFLARTVYIGSAVAIAWVSASFVNVNAHNLTDGKIAGWNFFRVFENSSPVAEAADEAPTTEDFQIAEAESEKKEAEALAESVAAYWEEQETEEIPVKTEEEQIEAVKNATQIKGEYVDWAFQYGNAEGVSPQLIVAIIERESNGNPDALGSCGEQGLMQLTPKWFKAEMQELGVTNLFDPESNIKVGAHALAELFEKHEEVYETLMYYNAGYAGLKSAQNCKFSEYATEIVDRSYELERLSE